MSETISRPFTFVKDGVFCFSRRIPNELKCHYKMLSSRQNITTAPHKSGLLAAEPGTAWPFRLK